MRLTTFMSAVSDANLAQAPDIANDAAAGWDLRELMIMSQTGGSFARPDPTHFEWVGRGA